MNLHLLIKSILLHKSSLISRQKLIISLLPQKKWNLHSLNNILQDFIIDKINIMHIPTIDIEYKLAWKFTPNGRYLLEQ